MINFKSLFKKNNKNIDSKQKDSNKKVYNEKKCNEKLYDFITLDFETANNNLNSPCSIGIIAVKNESIVQEYYSLIDPQDNFHKENIDIHGIKQEDIKDAPTFEELQETIKSFIMSSQYVIAHNAQFDMSVLYYVLIKYNLRLNNFMYIDSINFTRPQTPNCGNSLQNKLEYFGLVNEEAHNALADAKATADIVLASIERSRFKSFHSYLKSHPSIKVNSFKQLNPSNETFLKRNKFERVKLSEITVSHDNEFDENHFFYDKTVVITGNFENFSKKELVQLVVDNGGVVRTGVSGKTDILITGKQDKSVVGSDGLSSKQRKANELIEKGSDLQLISEVDLKEII